jgi:hypothetical protein
MDRPLRGFQPAALPLEGRILLARVHVPLPPPVAPVAVAPVAPVAVAVAVAPVAHAASLGAVGFLGTPSSAGITQQVVQQGGEATVWLRGYTGGGPLQVQVATDPSSPAVGVNLPAVNQTVTIPGGLSFRKDGQSFASVTIPTNAGAPNPGEVDVNLTITPIDPPTGFTVQGGPLELRILAPDATTPPTIIGVAGTPDGIQLMFSKPMNPVQASNVRNYAVRETFTTISGKDDFLHFIPIQSLYPTPGPLGGERISTSTKSVPLRSANYDPADFTVTLIPKRKLPALGSESGDSPSPSPSFVVTPGSPAKTSAALRDGSSPAQGLTDLNGNAINQGGKPGKFWIYVHSGYTPFGGSSAAATTG